MPMRCLSDIIANQDLKSVGLYTTVRDAAQIMADCHISALLVIENGTLKGIFTKRDLLKRVIAKDKDPASTTIGSVMTSNPICLCGTELGLEAMRTMVENEIRHIPVVDVPNNRYGVVTVHDFTGGEVAVYRHELDFEHRVWEEL